MHVQVSLSNFFAMRVDLSRITVRSGLNGCIREDSSPFRIRDSNKDPNYHNKLSQIGLGKYGGSIYAIDHTRPALWIENVVEKPGVHHCCCHHPGARHWGEYCDLQCSLRSSSQTASL